MKPQTTEDYFYQIILPEERTNQKSIPLQALLKQQDTLSKSDTTNPIALNLNHYFQHFGKKVLTQKEKTILNSLPTYNKQDSCQEAFKQLEAITKIFSTRQFIVGQMQIKPWIENRTLRRNVEGNNKTTYEIQLLSIHCYDYQVTGNYVLFHLKLFVHNLKTGQTSKKDITVIPDKTLQLLTNDNKLALFDLAGIIMHRGPYGYGHYISYRPISKLYWACFNDNEVTPMNLETVLNQIKTKMDDFVPYVLLYKKVLS